VFIHRIFAGTLLDQEINIFARCPCHFPFICILYLRTIFGTETPFAYFSRIACRGQPASFQRPKFAHSYVADVILWQLFTVELKLWLCIWSSDVTCMPCCGTHRHCRRHISLLAFLKTGSWIVNDIGVVLFPCTAVKGKLMASALSGEVRGVPFLATLIRNLGARWRWLLNVTPRPLYPKEGTRYRLSSRPTLSAVFLIMCILPCAR
jgi:hypothetical protein